MNKCKFQKILSLSLFFSNLFLLNSGIASSLKNLPNFSLRKYLINNSDDLSLGTSLFKFQHAIKSSTLSHLVSGSKNGSKDKISEELEIVNELLIESKVQSDDNDTLYAEGNVKVTFKGNLLKADRLFYTKNSKIAKAEGNVYLKINNQIFQADKIEYDFINEKGNLQNVKGLINSEYIISDLDFKFEDNNNLDEITKIKRYKVLFTKNKVKNWIFHSETIYINKNKWSSKRAFFSNDLLDNDQIKLQFNDLEVSLAQNTIKLKSKINYLILEDKVNIPFWLGERTIVKDSEDSFGFQNRWNSGYDNINKDGFFIGRKLDEIKIGDDLLLNIEPQFLIQRVLKGETKSFAQKDFALNSPRVTRNISLSDYFALNSSIEGNINYWDFKVTKELNSLDSKKFANAFRTRIELSKEINLFESNFTNRFFGAYRDSIWNGSIGESEIYGAYGWQLDHESSWEDGLVEKNQIIILGLGNYKAEELTTSNLIQSYKRAISYQINQKIPIYEKQINNNYIDESYKYIPKPIQEGAFINSKFSALYNSYDDGNYQQYLGFGLGPEIILGNFKRNYLDYTRIGILPFYKFKSGNSVFKFDQISETFTIDLNFDQHLLGPLMIETKGTINLDSDSKDYGRFINSKIVMNWKKRAYSFGIFYQPHNEAGGINFSLNGFE